MASQMPEDAARAREQHAASQLAYFARRRVTLARIGAVMAVEGYVGIRVDAYDPKAHGEGVYWRMAGHVDAPPTWERMAVTRASKPRWSHYHSLYGPGGDFTTAAPHTLIFVRTQ